MLDLEGVKYPKRVELEFDQDEGTYQFVLEGSSDGNVWSIMVDYRHNQEEIDTVTGVSRSECQPLCENLIHGFACRSAC